jgi:hypothetical protein
VKKKPAPTVAQHQSYYDIHEAASYLGVSESFFLEHIRPLLPAEHDFRAPSAEKPMPKLSRADLDAWAKSRRRVKAS